MNRRLFVKSALTAGVAGMMSRPVGADPAHIAEGQTRAFRFVHFGDTHVGAVTHAAGNVLYAGALRHVHAMSDPPDFILHTGDIITDAFWASQESASSQWEVYRDLMRQHCTIPVRYTLGNHDVNFGWDAGGAFPGKNRALRELGLTSPYYSFDHRGWHFIVLDNTQPGGATGFQHFLDDAQFAWLERDLAQTDRPVVIASHAPILTVACFFEPLAKTHPDGLAT